MRNMSFALTTDQIRARTKTVTRRRGWTFVKAGDLIRAVERCQGLKKGEKIKPLAVLRVQSVRREMLGRITFDDCAREGFPGMGPSEFAAMFCSHMGGTVHDEVTRIEFDYISKPDGSPAEPPQ